MTDGLNDWNWSWRRRGGSWPTPAGRRHLAGGAIRAAILGVLGVGAVTARPAAAADGNSLQLGSAADVNNTATTPTMLTYAGSALTDRSALSVGAAPSAADQDTGHPAALGGYAKGALADGVHGSTNRVDGYGVVAIDKSVFPLDARSSGTAPLSGQCGFPRT